MTDSSPQRILVVDDEENIVGFISAVLTRSGYEVISTTRGKEAVSLAKEKTPHLIILDMRIPDLGGEEIFRILSQDKSTSRIPIIYLTGTVSRDEEKFMHDFTGRMKVLAKPTTAEKILQAVKKTLSS